MDTQNIFRNSDLQSSQSTQIRNLQYFKLALELEEQFKGELIKNQMHFRPSLNSISLVSVSKERSELGVRCSSPKEWSSEVLNSYIEEIKNNPGPQRPTPEKSLQSWIIKKAQMNNQYLPFDSAIKFITTEFASYNSTGTKVVADIIGYNTLTNQLVIIELKSGRNLKRLIAQVNNFEGIFNDKYDLFLELVQLFGFNELSKTPQKAIVWPYIGTISKDKLKEFNITEFTYEPAGDGYTFINQSLAESD